MHAAAILALTAGSIFGQDPELRLKSRTEPAPATGQPAPEGSLVIVPAGTKIPIELRQPLSTNTAQPGDPVYAQTSFPVLAAGSIAIPAGTWVQGVVDTVKRAGRIKGTAEMTFHLTRLIYPSGVSVDMAAAVDRVPGDTGTSVREPNTVSRDPEKQKDLEHTIGVAAHAGAIGSIAGAAASPSIRGIGVGGLTGVAAGALIGVLTRGTDVLFPTGTAVEIALTRAIAVDRTPQRP